MFERQERVAIILLVAVAVAVTATHLILSGLGKQPFSRPYTDNSSDGDLVFFEGEIDQIILTKSGGHMIVTVKNTSVFLPAQVVQDITLQKGDRIFVYGTVQTYQGKKEIVISDPGDVRVSSVNSP
ncbi:MULTISPECIES: hypothetical protein [unclassified Methanoregula]|uniref:hypothetical protein n=1 Tax=unclassified Methanoregula TaxID=2649730 RepID=UPI0009CFEC06|nr:MULTISPECIES: hypothetical protein [unclassified Methanoregula]OPX61641.1 MAG: hypothetical protein A4E33_02739 [Methanoregula sp. PtaB.Bin085]OPY34050.1 MAG: hypothetical protein A4E34_01639 [Methanoregula sp. PtaU1.Bin006]